MNTNKMPKLLFLFFWFVATLFIGSNGYANTALPLGKEKTAMPKRLPFPYELEVWQSGLAVPWQIVFSKNTTYFTQRNGIISVVINNILQKEPWAKLTTTRLRGEGGLLGIALHPNFEKNGKLYAAYTTQAQGKTINRLVMFTQVSKNNKLYGSNMRILLDDIPGSSNHNGGTLKLGPDNLLYWTMGDKYKSTLAPNLKSYNGKILRLKLDGGIPKENPFPGSHIYSYGHRNPQGIAFVPGKKGFFSTEHGPSGRLDCCQDEVNWIEVGKNYGWPTISGGKEAKGLESPLLHSGYSHTWAPGGATFVIKGSWKNSLLYTGLRGKALYRLTFVENSLNSNGKKPIIAAFYSYLDEQYGRLRDIAHGPDGYYYLLTSNKDGRGSPQKNDDKILRFKISR